MWLNIRRRFRAPRIENRAFYYFKIDTALLIIIVLNCFLSITGLFITALFHRELINTKCYFRYFTPILFVLQFIPVFWMFANDSPKAAFIASYCEFIATMGLIAGNFSFCSTDWKYEALIIYVPRILSLYVFIKALMFFTYQQQMFDAINNTDITETSSSSESNNVEEVCVVSP